MRQRGAGELVSLSDCRLVPGGHIPCVPPFVAFLLEQVDTVAQGL
jgi:hypothetical protein